MTVLNIFMEDILINRTVLNIYYEAYKNIKYNWLKKFLTVCVAKYHSNPNKYKQKYLELKANII